MFSEPTKSNQITACDIAKSYESETLRIEDVITDCKHRIEEREPTVGAWQFLDWKNVEVQVDRLKQVALEKRGALWGVPIAIKDVYDTSDMPTEYGSSIYSGNRPRWDAAAVARLRAAGAIILGKTVTTEFAYWGQGKTRNPLKLDCTPGGSSSGSAAAVADLMVPLATGSQTAASTIRPASYCGIVGFKPTLGRVSVAGIKALANSMDTAGVFARSVGDIACITSVLTADSSYLKVTAQADTPAFRLWRGKELHAATDGCRNQLSRFLDALESFGAPVYRDDLPKPFEQLLDAQSQLMAYEANRELAYEYEFKSEALSLVLNTFLKEGGKLTAADRDAVLAQRQSCLASLDQLFGASRVLVLPSTPDTAPLYEQGTGDPVMSRAWTLLGLPSITLPWFAEGESMPYGIQLACRPGEDQYLLGVAKWLTKTVLKQRSPDD